jgi:hypothetical protein
MEQHTIDLDTLTEAQARDLYASLAMKYGRPGAKLAHETFTADETLIWDAINEQVGQRRNLGDVLAKCGKEYTRAAFADDVEYVMGWFDRGCGQRINRTQRQAIVNTAVDCLARQMTRSQAPVVHKTLVQQLTSLPSALDRAFPGYADAKLLDRVAAIAA